MVEEVKTEPTVADVRRSKITGEVFHVVMECHWPNGQLMCRIVFRRYKNRRIKKLEPYNKELFSEIGEIRDATLIPSHIYNPMARTAYAIIFEK